jgi:hypothetical protein
LLGALLLMKAVVAAQGPEREEAARTQRRWSLASPMRLCALRTFKCHRDDLLDAAWATPNEACPIPPQLRHPGRG